MNLVFLNLYHGGHHGQHVHDLITYHQTRQVRASVTFVVSEAFTRAHPDVVTVAKEAERIQVSTTTDIPETASLLDRDLRLGTEALRWTRRLTPNHLCFLYLDHAQLSLGLRLRGGPTLYSGIHFRPSFHYPTLEGKTPSFAERLRQVRKKALVRLMLSNPQLHTLFELDPYAVGPIRALGRPHSVVALPEPMTHPTAQSPTSLVNSVESGRRLAVFFGILDDRKGMTVLLDALELLPASAAASLTVLFAGSMPRADKPRLMDRVAKVKARTHVQILLDERFLDEGEIQPLLERADLVLAPYVGHIGSSGVLVRSAAARRPVLTSNEGVLGAHVRTHCLGLAVDTRSPTALAEGLQRWLADPDTISFDASKAAAFSAANTSEAFAETIFSRLLQPNGVSQTPPSYVGPMPA